jgi:hypothetical protein
MDVQIDHIEVVVEAEYDDGGMLGTSDSRPGYLGIRYTVRIKSSASEEEIHQVLDESERYSPYFDIFMNPTTSKRIVEIYS